MEHIKRTIDVGDWTMDVHAERDGAGTLWRMRVSQIRTVGRSRADWTDDRQRYANPELALAAAKTWAETSLSPAAHTAKTHCRQ